MQHSYLGLKSRIALSIIFVLLFLFRVSIPETLGQEDSNLSGYLPNYSTISPSALYNGIPDISIPLYTLNGRSVSVPVSLSYDASGIKVQQEATSVGLGWVLNAGGYIVHETRDWFDLAGVDRVSADTMAGVEVRFEKGESRYWDGTGEYDVRHKYDNLPDYFYYNCNGRTGKFILSSDLSTVHEIPETAINIVFDHNKIIMTWEDGTEYHFERSQMLPDDSDFTNTESMIYVLKSIYTQQKDEVSFSYYSPTYSKKVFKTIYDPVNEEYFHTFASKDMPVNLVKKIQVNNAEAIEFEFGEDRLDCYTPAPDSMPQIAKIKYLDADGNTQKYYELTHNYFSSDRFIQYLPPQKEPTGEYILKNNSGIKVTYDSILTSYNFKQEYPALGYINGQLDTIENHFRRGHYLFTRENGKTYAVLNQEYLTNCWPDLPDANSFVYDPTLCGGCSYDQALEDYMNYVYAYNRMLEDYYENNCSEVLYKFTIHDSGMYYMEIDTAYMNRIISILSDDVDDRKFRPYYYSWETTPRLRLDTIQEYSSDGQLSKPPMTFQYNEDTKLPHSCSRDFDHWGYYNLVDTIPNHSPVPDESQYDDVFDSKPYWNPTLGDYNGNREALESKMKAGILEQINYPGGGYTKYHLEANRARSNETGTEESVVGGLRVKMIETGDGDGNKLYTKYYYKEFKDNVVNGIYTLDTTVIGSGYLYAKSLQYEMGIDVVWKDTFPTGTKTEDLVKFGVANSVLPLNKTKGGYVGYSSVGVQQEDASGNHLGTTVHRFYADSPQQFGSVINSSGVPDKFNSFMKYVLQPYVPSPMLGTLEEKIVADKWGNILLTEENTYCLTEPNRRDLEPSTYYTAYAMCNAQSVGGRGYYYRYKNPGKATSFDELYDIVPKKARLSIKRRSQYFPEQGSSISDSIFYLYDTPNSKYEIGHDQYAWLYWDIVQEYSESNLESFEFDSDLDAYYNPDAVIPGYLYIPGHTQNLIQKIHFNSKGDTIRSRYWYAPAFGDTSLVYSEMMDRNMISAPIRTEVFKNGTRMEGQKSSFEFVSGDTIGDKDFVLPIETEIYYQDAYEKVSEITAHNTLGQVTESLVENGNLSARIYGYGNTRVVAQVTNAELDEIIYQDFEENSLDGWSLYNSGSNISSTNPGTGILALSIGSSGCKGIQKTVQTSDLDLEDSYKFSALFWQDNPGSSSNPCLKIKIQHGGGTTWLKKESDLEDETWTKTELTVDLSEYSNISGITLYALNGDPGQSSSQYGAAYVDHLRFHPQDSRMTTYTYDPIFGQTSITDPAGQTVIYEYDGLGRLVLETNQEGIILKKINHHLKDQ